MIRLSSSLTLGLSLFLPVFWFVFFGCLTLFVLVKDPDDLPVSNAFLFKSILITCYLFFGCIVYFVFRKLKRVEIENTEIFVTNYFKTIHFDSERISELHERKILGIHLITMVLNYKSSFGKKIRFISDYEKYRFLNEQLNSLKKS